MSAKLRVTVVAGALLAGAACNASGLTTYTDTSAGTDVGSDSGSDTEGTDSETAGTDSAPPDHTAPVLKTFEVRELPDAVEIAFKVTDAEGDLEGGTFQLGIDGNATTLSVPNDIDYWSPASESKIRLTVNPCDDALHTFTGSITDAWGLTSNQLQTLFSLPGPDAAVTEIGDDRATFTPLGVINPPMLICGDLYAAGNDSVSVYTQDIDWMEVQFATTRAVLFSLVWEQSSSDYDLHVLDGTGATVASSIQDGATQPETINTVLTANTPYYVGVAGWNGLGGGWALSID